MKRAMSWALLVAGTALAVSAAPAIPAAAATSGTETFSGTIVFAAMPGANSRTVLGSVVRARGVFKGVGRVVEIAQGDPTSQEDLVFPGGTLHVLSTTGKPLSPFIINPHSCLFTGTAEFTYQVTGGTGKFAGATGNLTGTVSGRALLARNPDGTCSTAQQPRHEVDKFDVSGTLTF
jgi:type 1 fimbria pilin